MKIFNGTLYNNGNKQKMCIFIDPNCLKPYFAEAYFNQKFKKVLVGKYKMMIDGTDFFIETKTTEHLTIIYGIEDSTFFQKLIRYFRTPSYFILYNKDEV